VTTAATRAAAADMAGDPLAPGGRPRRAVAQQQHYYPKGAFGSFRPVFPCGAAASRLLSVFRPRESSFPFPNQEALHVWQV